MPDFVKNGEKTGADSDEFAEKMLLLQKRKRTITMGLTKTGEKDWCLLRA